MSQLNGQLAGGVEKAEGEEGGHTDGLPGLCDLPSPETGKKAYGSPNGKASYFPALPAPSSHSLRTFL